MTPDPEMAAITTCINALEALDEGGRHRAVRYIAARFPVGPVRTREDGLRGDRLATVAVELLDANPPPNGNGIHYRDWFERVAAEHIVAPSHDPLASFLAAICRHPRVERVGGQRSGRYRLGDE